MSWGTLGAEITLEGASSRTWKLRFERRLAPREGSATANAASSVWLVRDIGSARLYAAKRQNLVAEAEVDALVDEAAAWRASCLADESAVIPELVDVFVERATPLSVTFLAEFCARGLLPRSPPLSEPVLLTVVADLAAAADALPSPHGHISYESLLVDDAGRLRLAGFGAHRSAILRDNPGLAKQDDAFDIGVLLYDLVFGSPPPESLEVPDSNAYSQRLTRIIGAAFGHAMPSELLSMALSAGAEQRAPVIDVEKKDEPERALPMHVSRATERNVDRLVAGDDIPSSFAALLGDLRADAAPVAAAIFKSLFKKAVSKDPVCAMRIFTMLHNLMIDGPDTMLAAVRKNDKFMEWAESSWTREAIESAKNPDETHPSTFCFAGGELAFYAALLRRKARFHMLAAGGFSGRWERTGAVDGEGRDVLVTRRRKVLCGMADLVEMSSELGGRLASARDDHAPVKQAALGAIVSESCLAYNAALAMSHEVETVQGAKKLSEGIGRMYAAARSIVFAVEHVPSAGGEQWVEQFAQEVPPDTVAEAEMRERGALGEDETADIPEAGWQQTENIVEDEEEAKEREEKEKLKAEKKRKKEDKKKRREEAAKKAKEELTASDGALVVHGEGNAAKEAVATMFGDLLSIDDSRKKEVIEKEAPRPMPNMTNAQALALAFGVPEEAVGGQHLALPPPRDFDYDDEEGGGYADYQAQQEEEHSRQQTQQRQVNSTAVWAARSRYGGGAVAVSGAASRKNGHPAFYQCGVSDEEEAQVAAESAQSSQRNGFGGSSQSARRGGNDNRSVPNAGYPEETGSSPYSARQRAHGYYEDDQRDSLDDEDERPIYAPPPPRQQPVRNSYYDDDYDSYESVTYSVEEDDPDRGNVGAPMSATTPLQSQLQQPVQPQPVTREPERRDAFTLDSKLILNLKKLRTGDKISDGGIVAVYKGQYNREDVAIKKLAKGKMDSNEAVSEFTNEVRVMCALSHPAILNCIAASLRRPNYVFVTELMKRGTLFDVLYKSRIKLTWALIRKIALQIAEAMQHMHEQGFLHRDLKSLNVFIDGSYNVKVGDFGFSKHMQESQGTGLAGTYQYMAPEVLRGEPHSAKSDVYSYAQLLCEIVSGVPPFHGMEAREVAERVVADDIRPPIPVSCQRAYVNLIQMCWSTVPSRRPSFAEIVNLIQSSTK